MNRPDFIDALNEDLQHAFTPGTAHGIATRLADYIGHKAKVLTACISHLEKRVNALEASYDAFSVTQEYLRVTSDEPKILAIAAELYHALKGLHAIAVLFESPSTQGEWFSQAIERTGNVLQHVAPFLVAEGALDVPPEAPQFDERKEENQ